MERTEISDEPSGQGSFPRRGNTSCSASRVDTHERLPGGGPARSAGAAPLSLRAAPGLLSRGGGFGSLVVPMAVLLGFAAVLTAVSIRLVRMDAD